MSKGEKNYVRHKSRSKSRSKYKSVECHHCGKRGHIKRNCFKLKYEMNGSKQKKDDGEDRVSIATSNDLVTVHDENTINLVGNESSWVFDTGASLHVTPRKEYFTSYTSGDFGVLKMGNDDLSKVIGIGDVCLESSNGSKLLLKDVRHARDIRLNLI